MSPGAVVAGHWSVVQGGFIAGLTLEGEVLAMSHHDGVTGRLGHVGPRRVGHYDPALLHRGHHTRCYTTHQAKMNIPRSLFVEQI